MDEANLLEIADANSVVKDEVNYLRMREAAE
jgi:hypothetical protein